MNNVYNKRLIAFYFIETDELKEQFSVQELYRSSMTT